MVVVKEARSLSGRLATSHHLGSLDLGLGSELLIHQ